MMVLTRISRRKCYGFEAQDEWWISGILVRIYTMLVLIRIAIRKCYGFEALDEYWISGILVRR